IYNALALANVSAFLHWWGLNTSFTNSGILYFNGSTIQTSGRYWTFTNYSRFIRPGATRIAAVSGDSNLETTAFRNLDGSIIIVALNTATSDTPASFSLQHAAGAGFAVPYLTNASNGAVQQTPLPLQHGTFNTTVPARSLVTYQIRP
ncbi:MAG TPA: glycoside hydrolase family 30 beta sandwich domain-containing protein, partial [Ktedonobacteraceae bacterium]